MLSSRRIRVVAADDNRDFCEVVRAAINDQDDMECVGLAHDGESAIAAVAELRPDLLILDHVMPNLDGIGVLEALRGAPHRPRVMMLTAFGQESLIRQASDLGVDYYLMKPVDISMLVERVRQVANPHAATNLFREGRRRQQVERQVAMQLTDLGVPPHFKGYTYLKDAVTLVALDPELLGAITTKLYPEVARLRQSTPPKVERAIRHAIESTWTRGNLESIDRLFAYTVDACKGKPTNSSFIARLADQIRMELMVG